MPHDVSVHPISVRRLTALSVVALLGSAGLVAGAAGPAVAANPCDPAVIAAAGFTPVLQIDLPQNAGWLDQDLPYSLDKTAEVGPNFDRVGYCLELDGPSGPQWVWTAMEPFSTDARRIGLPTRKGDIVRQPVGDLEVSSNVPDVTNGIGQTGYLEMWPNQYQTNGSSQVANASALTFDADDNPTSSFGYGSFQVHQVGATRPSALAAKTVFAVNTFTEPATGTLSIGIGTNTNGQPDWTFTNNAGRYSKRKFTAYVRPAMVALTEAPQDRQLIPRDSRGGAVVPVAGRVTDSRVRQVQLRVTGPSGTQTLAAPASRPFRFTPRITAGLHEYTFELRAIGQGINRVVAKREGVVSGDVYVVQGQSNAEASRFNGNASGEESPYLRSFGTSTSNAEISGADRTWHYAAGDVSTQSGSVGQWAIRMGRRIVDRYKVPVALVNGAHGGQPISFFQRNDSNPDELSTNYGRLRQRLASAGLIDHVKGVLFYQGESDNDNASVHTTGFSSLLQDWRSDFGMAVSGGSKYYVHQVRTSPCGNSTSIALREAQRKMGDSLGVTVLSTNGLSGHDGCHYAWVGGYRELGDHNFAVIARDWYGGTAAGVAAPNPASASVTGDGSQITVQLRAADVLTVDAASAANFRLAGTTATVQSVAYQSGGKLVLTLSGPATGATGVSYLSHNGAGPWITNATGTGLLAFDLPLT
ncbi:sialate O-acetylesterase [Kribbella sp. NBC_01245]|uniref:sialate O-acetylesterase n=1 Tax=Kribbella sp. NBC_01245 TaxID=2903578 RepID=UPI002E29386C|nr:sialate O-acetylesterase [Kribbella sp. NBC_01245]